MHRVDPSGDRAHRRVRRRRALVLGYYGRQNFGDELFRWVLSRAFALQQPYWDVRFMAPEGAGPGAGTSFLPRGVHHRRFTATGPVGLALRTGAHLAGAAWADTVVLGGGSLLEGVPTSLRAHLSARSRTSVMGLGVSIGPFRGAPEASAVGRGLAKFDGLAVRDRSSLVAARQLGYERAIYSGDIAALYKPTRTRATAATMEDPMIVLSPCRTAAMAPQDQLGTYESIAMALANHADNRVRFVVMALNNHHTLGDDDLSRELVLRLRRRGAGATTPRFSELGAPATRTTLSGAAAIISTRLHGAVASYLSARPFALLEYHEKCSDFLDDIGQSRRRRIAPHPTGARGWAAELATALLDESEAPRTSVADYRSRCTSAIGAVLASG